MEGTQQGSNLRRLALIKQFPDKGNILEDFRLQSSRQVFEDVRTLPSVEKLLSVHPPGRSGNTVRTLGQAFRVLQVLGFP